MVETQAGIFITATDLSRLRKLVDLSRQSHDTRNQEYLDRLEDELERAEVVESQDIPADVITMRSRVRMTDLDSGKELTYSLVFPNEANFSEGKISVLAPIGTAMMGYRVGDTIEWQVPAGLRRLRVEEICYQPEAAGDYHL